MSDLYVESIGDGTPILMMHGGLGLDHTYLRPVHDALAETHRVVYYDHRWNGRSARSGGTTIADWVDDAAGLIDQTASPSGDAVGRGGATASGRGVVYGHSYGAWLAINFALAHPDRVERLILCGASPQLDYAEEAIGIAMSRDPVLGAQLVAGLTTPPATDDALEQLYRTILPLYFKGPVPPGCLDGMRFSAQGFALGSAELATLSTESRLHELQMPVLILNGAWDFITPPRHARRLLAAPHATYEEFADSGHFPFVEEPDRYLAILRRWLLT